ncbi:MAG: coniferyl aldehyde dehydrogenase [Rubrivivax sp.]
MRGLFDRQRAAFERERHPSLAVRRDRLQRLLAMTDAIAPRMVKAIGADFGHRSAHVTRMADQLVVRAGIDHTLRHLARWMKPRRVSTPFVLLPGHSRLQPQALGVVGVVSPWNYPYQLAIAPAASALAAGNRVLIKPSEATPRFSELLQLAVAERFDADELALVTGDDEVGSAFVELPFDHLLFTGSTAVGRKVALAAAANLTPVTLELGGKSPAILNADCDLDVAVPRLMAGKLLNTGQTCIAPDYLLVHRSLMARLPDALRAATRKLYPTLADNPDYTSIVNSRHLARLQGLLDDARVKGATVLPLHDETAVVQGKLPPYALFEVDDRMQVMQEEIFGPLLPVLPFDDLDAAIDHVNRRDRPLALYWFGHSTADRERVLAGTVSGGVTINDCLWHVAQEELPFGGVGASGQGSYHGEAGFRTFSHDKPVFVQSRWAGTALMASPYGRGFESVARLLRWIGAR